jgi:hypothetical protein
MSKKEAKQNAAKFLKEQAEIMGKYGEAPKLRGTEYQAALADTANKFHSLCEAAATKNQ